MSANNSTEWLETIRTIIRAMPPDMFWILVGGLVTLVAGALFMGALWSHSYRIMRSTPTVMVRSAMDGYSELAGQLEPLSTGGTITAPVSGQPCVWYRCRIQQLDLSLTSGLWMDLFVEEEQRPCVLRDGSGSCVIDTPMALAIFGRKRERWHVNLPIQRKGLPHPLQGFGRLGHRTPMRFTEERLEAGARGYAIGDLRTVRLEKHTDEATERTVAAWKDWRTDYIASLRGSPEQLAPNPADYSLNPDVRRRAIPLFARACGMKGKWLPVLGPTGSLRHPFLVAGKSQRLLGRQLRVRIGLAVGVAAIAGAPLLLLLLARFAPPGTL